MQSLWRSFYHQAYLVNSTAHSRRALTMAAQAKLMQVTRRAYATDIEIKQKEQAAVDPESRNKRLGVDMTFNEQKHAYVLTFPWNFQEIINDFEHDYKPLASSSWWHRFVFSNAEFEFNKMFREFHQYCALPDYNNFDMICEAKLAQYVKESVRRIHFHGLDLEMANLTVDQPRMKLLKVEIQHGISVDRSLNKPASEYNIKKTTLCGAPQNIYLPKNDTRHFLDNLDSEYKPYVVAATVLIESPMKLYVQNQNFSSVLFGSTDEEMVKNVVRFETPARWLDLFRVLPTTHKPKLAWKMTDFNNVLNENPYLPQY